MTNMYPEQWVRAICTKLYGSPIANRTWQKYKHICKVPDGRKLANTHEIMISKTHCQWLMMLAIVRREQKRGDNPVDWKSGVTKSGVTLRQIILLLDGKEEAYKIIRNEVRSNFEANNHPLK